MKVDREAIHSIAKRAKLKLTDQEAIEFADEFKKLLNYFSGADQTNLPEIGLNHYKEKQSVLRKDKSKTYENKEELFQNVREKKEDFIVVPKVMD